VYRLHDVVGRMALQNIPTPSWSEAQVALQRLGRAIQLLSDPATLQTTIQSYRANSTYNNSEAHQVDLSILC